MTTQARTRLGTKPGTRPGTRPTVAADAPQDDAGGVAAVERALALLGAFDDAALSLSLAELAGRTGLYKSTILRLLVSLERAGFVERGDDSRYRIGATAWRVGALFLRDLRLDERLMPVMSELSSATEESVSFYVAHRAGSRTERLCLLRVDAPRSVRDHVRVGETLPLGAGSGGRVIRAYQGPRSKEDDAIRRDGIHASWGERDPEIAGVSAPVFGADGALVGALTLSAPTSRRDRAWLARVAPKVRAAAARASRLLGAQA